MEVNKQTDTAWLDKSHPNYERWKRARDLSAERGLFVKKIISRVIEPKNLKILDFGSGEGGTSRIFASENTVISFDLNLFRLVRQGKIGFDKINGSSGFLPFKPESFDLVILQDVIEHLPDTDDTIFQIFSILKPGGILYLSTPNRYSLINILADPHWGIPLLALFNRRIVKDFFLKFFRKTEYQRNDVAELLSLKQLIYKTQKYFELRLMTKLAATELLQGNRAIVWSDFHLKLVRIIHLLKSHKLILNLANDKNGFLNNFLTPAFYCVLKKKNIGVIR